MAHSTCIRTWSKPENLQILPPENRDIRESGPSTRWKCWTSKFKGFWLLIYSQSKFDFISTWLKHKVIWVAQCFRYKKKMYLKTANLLTGETEATVEEQAKVAEGIKQEIISHWHPNITINIVNDYTHWIPGQVILNQVVLETFFLLCRQIGSNKRKTWTIAEFHFNVTFGNVRLLSGPWWLSTTSKRLVR